MPQFDPANFLPQLAWLAAIFAVLYFVVVRPTLPRVGRVIDQREGVVSADLTAAEAAKAEADSIRERYDAGMAEARAKAQAEVADARSASAKAVEGQLQALGERLDAQGAEAAARVEAARGAARASLDADAAALTADVVARLTGLTVAPAEASAALAAAR